MRRLIALSSLLAIGAAPPTEPPAGEGVICMMGLINAAAEVGRRCYPGQNAVFQAELEREVVRIDQYVLKNSTANSAQIAEFKRKQARVGAPQSELCRADIIGVYKAYVSAGAEKLKLETDKLLARAGTPTWGDCL